jgi:hypothetical protein
VVAELRNSFWKITDSPRVSILRLYIGEGASSGGCQGALTMGGCGQGLGCAPLLCGRPLAPLHLSFSLWYSSGKNKTSGTCFIQF